MKKISVILDDYSLASLEKIKDLNNCTISDAINAAVIAYGANSESTMVLEDKPMQKVYDELKKRNMVFEPWCNQRGIDINRLKYLIKRCANGGTVWGFGNTKHKERDGRDERVFKTHTSWIAHCLKEDLGIDLI